MDFITIVSGLPRSGTSLAMQMLRAGNMPVLIDEVRHADEDNPRGYLEFEAVKRTSRDPSWLTAAQGKAVKMVYRLLYDLPPQYHYHVLLMTRKMTEVMASQRTMLARQQPAKVAVDDQQLAQVFARQMDECRAWLAARPNFAVLEVNYNNLIADPFAEATRINRFVESQLDVAAMAKCVDPALYRQRT